MVIRLTHIGAKKLQTVKLIMYYSFLDLNQSKNKIIALPSIIEVMVPNITFEKLSKEFMQLDAKIELVEEDNQMPTQNQDPARPNQISRRK